MKLAMFSLARSSTVSRALLLTVLLSLVIGIVRYLNPSFPTVRETIFRADFLSRDPSLRGKTAAKTGDGASQWQFNPIRDQNHYGLSQRQCLVAFPDLYRDIERARLHRQIVLGPIQENETTARWRPDGGVVQVMIYHNRMYVVDANGIGVAWHRPRAMATLHSLYRAVSACPEPLPDALFSLSVWDDVLADDTIQQTTWSYARREHQQSLWLMPDFGFWGWPEVGVGAQSDLRATLDRSEPPFAEKIPKVVWRGQMHHGSEDVRAGLVEHSQGQPWSDVQPLDWTNQSNIDERLLTMVDHCRYQFTAHTEGFSYSGRLKYLLQCESVLFSHSLDWIEHFHHLMVSDGPGQNYVPVQRNYSDLSDQIELLLGASHRNQAAKIADNVRRTFRERYLTPAAEACYWREMIHSWASVQAFKPDLWQEVVAIDKVTGTVQKQQRTRGVPFEAFAIMEATEWEMPAKGRQICVGP